MQQGLELNLTPRLDKRGGSKRKPKTNNVFCTTVCVVSKSLVVQKEFVDQDKGPYHVLSLKNRILNSSLRNPTLKDVV